MRDRNARLIWTFTILIIAVGLVALYSASYENVRVERKVFYDQLGTAGVGLCLMYFLGQVRFRLFFDIAYALYFINILLLILVLVSGHAALGATRWFNIFGIRFQPSELSKIAVILILARYFSMRTVRLSFGLIFKQPDLGSAILIFGIFLGMLFASGINIRLYFGFLGVCTALVPAGWHFLKEYQKTRLLVFLNPNIDPLGAGYTIIQSRIAVGSGQLLGKGWLAGTQNQLNFLPERHTDFIFSVIGEEWGFVGTMFLLGCYFGLIYTGLQIAQTTKDRFGHMVAVGIVTIMTLQVVINMSMTMGLSPVVGITLPLISYGRTSFMVFIVLMGLLLNLSRRR